MEHEEHSCVVNAVRSAVMCETRVLGWQRKVFWELAKVYLKSMSFT